MKKLMIAAAAVAVAGSASATLVYDYKASVKHTYEKEQRGNGNTFYVKYVKTAKLQGYFIQDDRATTALSRTQLEGAALSQKRGFLVLINRSAEQRFRAPKIMPAQLDVKLFATRVNTQTGLATGWAGEAYFYAGPFAALPNATHVWTASQDDGADWLFNNGTAAPGAQARTYGTEGSTMYLFGQHNNPNSLDNTGATPAICAFGDAWMNGAGFGTAGGRADLCCGWTSGGTTLRSISGNLKGGLFLCSIGGQLAAVNNTWVGFFALGMEDVYASDIGGLIINKAVQGTAPAQQLGTPANPGADEKTWHDGEIALSTSDVVSGTWTLRPSSNRFERRGLVNDATEQGFGWATPYPGCQDVLECIKEACFLLDRNYSLTTTTEPGQLQGAPSQGLISPAFAALYL